MISDTKNNRGSWRVWLLVCAAVVVLPLTACGNSGSSPTAGSSTSTISAQTTTYQKVLAFSECMRAHGVPNFPDPNSSGSIDVASVKNQINFQADPAKSAIQTCKHLLPDGGTATPAQLQKALNLLLTFSQCMRAHSVLNFPDPTLVNGKIQLSLAGTGITASTPHVVTADEACKPLLTKEGATP